MWVESSNYNQFFIGQRLPFGYFFFGKLTFCSENVVSLRISAFCCMKWIIYTKLIKVSIKCQVIVHETVVYLLSSSPKEKKTQTHFSYVIDSWVFPSVRSSDSPPEWATLARRPLNIAPACCRLESSPKEPVVVLRNQRCRKWMTATT